MVAIATNASAIAMAEEIFGDGVTVIDATYTGANGSSGIYSQGDTLAPGVTPSDTGVILSTGNANSFIGIDSNPNDSPNTSTNTSGVNNDADFNALAGANTYDAAFLDVDFMAEEDGMMTMQFVFSSEEYPEYTNTIYNDSVGVWVNGQEIPLEISSGSTDISTINSGNNVNLYNDNTGDQYNTEMDGFTVTMTLTFPVTEGVNSIRIGIADVGDSNYDSNLLIAGDSLQTDVIAASDEVTLTKGGTTTFDPLSNDTNNSSGTLTITHINGQAVVAGDTVTLTTGQVVTLNADGTFTLTTDNDEEVVNFTYGIENDAGNVDTGYVTVNTVPCFVAGTMIRTPWGEVAVQDLSPGDMVLTHDNGPQPVRWIGQRAVAAQGRLAPIHIRANTFGAHDELLVSPQHRVLIRDSLAELLFGEAEVLIAAKDLVNDSSVRVREGGEVNYVHILFDEHQVVFSAGLATESFLPGPQVTHSLESEIVDEICAIFPEIDRETGLGYSAAARRTLRAFEARVLVAQKYAA